MMAKKPAERPGYGELIAAARREILARLDPGRGADADELGARALARPNLDAAARRGRAPRERRPTSPRRSATADDATACPPRAFPGWLVLVTLASLALFVAGLVVYLRRDDGHAAATPATARRRRGVPRPPPARTPHPAAIPPGMLAGQEARWLAVAFYVDARPLGVEIYKKFRPQHAQAGPPSEPTVNVSYNDARSYVGTYGGRLLTSAEWDAAAVAPGFIVAARRVRVGRLARREDQDRPVPRQDRDAPRRAAEGRHVPDGPQSLADPPGI